MSQKLLRALVYLSAALVIIALAILLSRLF